MPKDHHRFIINSMFNKIAHTHNLISAFDIESKVAYSIITA
jgi:hypothetical protein